MSDAFRTELRKFDAERVLPAWDGLVRSQQARLEVLNVPTMFVTDDANDAEVRIETPFKHSHGSFRPHTKQHFLSEAG